jgi:hypothetical protein
MAEIAFEWSAKLWAETLGPQHPYVSTALAFLGWSQLNQDSLGAALNSYEQALRVAIAVVGTDAQRSVQLAGDVDWIKRRIEGDDSEPLPGPPDRTPVEWQ